MLRLSGFELYSRWVPLQLLLLILVSPSVMQLALSPSPRSPSEPISVTLDTQFVLKVEGVIERSQKLGQSIVRGVNLNFYDSIVVWPNVMFAT